MKYYLYRHIRKDKNKVFYIGIGTKRENFSIYEKEYSRAFSSKNRNKYWKNIVNITNYDVEILYESNDYTFIEQKEIEFIKLYGRVIDNGSLCNISTGGGGSVGFKHSKDTAKKMSERQKELFKNGKLESFVTKEKLIYQYDIQGNFIKRWKNAKQIADFLQVNKTAVAVCARGKVKLCKKFRLFYEFKGDKITEFEYFTNCKPIIQIDINTNLEIKSFKSARDACKQLGINENSTSAITRCADGKSKSSFGYKWKRK